MSRLALLAATFLVCSAVTLIPAADPPKEPVDPAHAKQRAAGLELFKKEVQQILVGRCVKCHGGEKTEGKFDLTTREGLLKGGETGIVAEAGKSKSSLLVKQIKHAGAMFLGPYSPVTVGDYIAGPSHVLPTGGAARMFSGLGVDDFIRKTHIISYTKGALEHVRAPLECLTTLEGLPRHFDAIKIRLA